MNFDKSTHSNLAPLVAEFRQSSPVAGGATHLLVAVRNINIRHGHSRDRKLTKVYRAWSGMKQRCSNSRAKCFHNYGGRGITVCYRWRNSFEAFHEDMGDPPVGFSLDRINNDGNYEPGNCRWATKKEQSRNHRANRLLTFRGHTLTVQDWSEQLGWPRHIIEARLSYGWSIEKILTTPRKQYGRRPYIATEIGLSQAIIFQRLRRGWSKEDAARIPVQQRGTSYVKKRLTV